VIKSFANNIASVGDISLLSNSSGCIYQLIKSPSKAKLTFLIFSSFANISINSNQFWNTAVALCLAISVLYSFIQLIVFGSIGSSICQSDNTILAILSDLVSPLFFSIFHFQCLCVCCQTSSILLLLLTLSNKSLYFFLSIV